MLGTNTEEMSGEGRSSQFGSLPWVALDQARRLAHRTQQVDDCSCFLVKIGTGKPRQMSKVMIKISGRAIVKEMKVNLYNGMCGVHRNLDFEAQ